jgi:hypothetical protein
MIDSAGLPVDVSLIELLRVLSSRRACLVADGEKVSGLLTISDLNRHAFRVALYTVLAALEVALARLIERKWPEPDRWLPKLSRDDQVRILGFWEVTRRFGVDTGPLAGCTLTQLVRIVGAIDDLWRELGFGTGSKARASLDRLPPFRNKVMHPVRPLVLARRDVAEIKQAVDRIVGMSPRLEGWLDARPL